MKTEMRKLMDQIKNFGKSQINESLDAKYKSDETYKHGVRSKYIIGSQGREDVLYFKTEEDAIGYVKQKPSLREYLGLV